MVIKYYVIRNMKLVETDLMTWATDMEKGKHIIHQTQLEEHGVKISTVCLGFDHSFSFDENPAKPIMFETMAFGLPSDEEIQIRTSTLGEAKNCHFETVEHVKKLYHKEQSWKH